MAYSSAHLNQKSGKSKNVYLVSAGVIAPQASCLNEFLRTVEKGQSALTKHPGLHNAFLAGMPKCDFNDYKAWIDKRHDPKRFATLNEKSGDLVKFTIGACIDALSVRPGLEEAIKDTDPRTCIYIATGLGDLNSQFTASREFDITEQKWNEFWAAPERNQACRDHLSGVSIDTQVPVDPRTFPVDSTARFEAFSRWNAYWVPKSQVLSEYLQELVKIESTSVVGEDIESAKLNLIRSKTKAKRELADRYGFPTPPWEGVSANLLWNIPNAAASQLSMLLGVHGVAVGSNGACASFGLVLDQAMNEIRSGKVDIAIVGATDVTPTKELICGFYLGRLAVMGDIPGIPFCDLRGTHIAGGACIWILATEEIINKYKLEHCGVEILSVGLSSDAEHIITPSKQGPKLAISRAFSNAEYKPEDINLWDMHATGTPGDWNELSLIDEFVPKEAYISARKGVFGHGMATCGGWELTAQLLGNKRLAGGGFELCPTGIEPSKVNPKIMSLKRKLLLDKPVVVKPKNNELICGKLNMGVGGVSSCVIAKVFQS